MTACTCSDFQLAQVGCTCDGAPEERRATEPRSEPGVPGLKWIVAPLVILGLLAAAGMTTKGYDPDAERLARAVKADTDHREAVRIGRIVRAARQEANR